MKKDVSTATISVGCSTTSGGSVSVNLAPFSATSFIGEDDEGAI